MQEKNNITQITKEKKENNFIIETRKLVKKYGDQTAVNEVELHVKKGSIYGLLGRNGAGKTTIMKMILGLTKITSGEVDVFGENMIGKEEEIYPKIGAIIEAPGFYPNLTGTDEKPHGQQDQDQQHHCDKYPFDHL